MPEAAAGHCVWPGHYGDEVLEPRRLFQRGRIRGECVSTHYGRMIDEDDRTIMFANPEDAAEYLGFDLTPGAR